ncbi:MAG TPA: SPASM domain-containing protein, partial [Bacteroidales bacterium]|nr:SPASM domain-containing protein [Bacteroidales bacterium]
CKFLKENNFLVGISIDGPKDLHDYYRLFKNDQPSFDRVMKGVNLLKKHHVAFNTLSVVNKETSKYPLEVYRFLKDIGSGYMQFIPIVERNAIHAGPQDIHLVSPDYEGEAEVTEWSVDPVSYGHFLIDIFNEWVRNDVGRYYVQIFDVTLANWIGEAPGLCVFSETCGDATVMEHNGDLFSCDHFVYDKYFLGNIMNDSLGSMVKSDPQVRFGLNKRNKLPAYCISCEYRFACHGECPKHRFMKTPDGEPGLNYLCETYKMFFQHVHPYMQYMGDELAKKRPPSNVMNWVRRVDDRKAGRISEKRKTVGRNDPCPCGSGKKYKNCCINVTNY